MAHDALLCVQTNAKIHEENRFRFHGDQHYLKSRGRDARASSTRCPRRATTRCGSPSAPTSSSSSASRCCRASRCPRATPRTTLPARAHLRGREGALRRRRPRRACCERLEYELGVIESMGFSAYFLVVWDLVRVREVARASASVRAGGARRARASRTACASSTSTRSGTTCCSSGSSTRAASRCPTSTWTSTRRYRGEMIKYAAQKYGADHVAQIVTFSTIKARAAVRDAARVLDYPYGVGDKIAKLMPPLIMGRDTPLYACIEQHPKFEDGYKMAARAARALRAPTPTAKRVIDVAKGLEGLRRQDGIHAAAVVITREPLTEYLPVQRKPEPGAPIEDAPIVTQYEMHGVEDLGLLKMDFLGLRNLDVIEITLDLVEQAPGVRPDIDNVPLDDQKTFDLLRNGDTIGVFQLEGGPMRALIRALAPSTFEDVAALVALYRPGPMAPEHAQRLRRPQERPEADHVRPPRPRGDPRAHVRADDLPGAADARRRRSSPGTRSRRPTTSARPPARRSASSSRKERSKFVDGCVAQGHDRAFGERMFDIIEPFADYSFNKSHSVGYGLRRVPDRLPEGEPPARVPRRAAHEREGRQGQVGDLPQRVPPARHPRARPRRQRVRDGLRGVHRGRRRRARRDPLRALRGAQRRRGRRRQDHRGARRGRPVHRLLRLLRARRPVGAEQAHDRVADQGRAASTRSATPARASSSCSRTIVDVMLARRREREAGIMSLFGDTVEERGRRRRLRSTAPIPDQEFAKTQRLAFEKEMLGLYVSRPPADGRRARAAALHRRDAHRAQGDARGRAAHRRRRRHRARAASTRSAATSWPRSCSRTSAPRSR